MFVLPGICLIGSVGYGLYTCRSAIEQELLLAEYELSEAKRIAKEREEAAKAEAALLAREKAEWEKTQRLMREKAEQEEAERQAREKAEREESDKQAKIIEHYQKGECYLNGSGGYMQSYMEAVSHFRVAAMSGHERLSVVWLNATIPVAGLLLTMTRRFTGSKRLLSKDTRML